MTKLRLPHRDLRAFPRRTLRAEADLFRIHRAARGPWWFSSDGSGRFDLEPPWGTCYLSLSMLGAWVEVFREIDFVDDAELSIHRVSTLHAPNDLVLADCTSARARAFGVTAAVHSTTDYGITQAWVAVFHDHGFDGVRYFCGHDPSQREVGIALFGNAGDPGWAVADTSEIGIDVIRNVRRRFGIRVVPS